MNVYGIPPRTPEQVEYDQQRHFNYIKSLIEAESLNPEDDYDREREWCLLEKISISECSQFQREQLVALLKKNED